MNCILCSSPQKYLTMGCSVSSCVVMSTPQIQQHRTISIYSHTHRSVVSQDLVYLGWAWARLTWPSCSLIHNLFQVSLLIFGSASYAGHVPLKMAESQADKAPLHKNTLSLCLHQVYSRPTSQSKPHSQAQHP